VLNRNNWTVLPIPQDVIDRVHNLARRAAADVALTFGDRFGELIPDNDDDDDNDDDYLPPDEDSDTGDDDEYPFDEGDEPPDPDPADVAGVMGYIPVNDGPNVDPNNENANDNSENESNEENRNDENSEGSENEHNEHENNNNNENKNDGNENGNKNENNIPNDAPVMEPEPTIATESDDDTYEPEEESESEESNYETKDPDADEVMDQLYGPRSSTHGLRPRKPRNYEHLHATSGETRNESGILNTPYGIEPTAPRDYEHMFATLAHTAMTQMSMKKGIKEFGKEGVDAVLVELQQLHDRNVLEPQNASQMTREEKRASLNYLMFLKKKRSGSSSRMFRM
jgi:hypothetical protein